MAQFQASLIDPTTQEASVVIDADCSQLQITDSSNYVQFTKITGTVAVTNANNTINGTGTLFTSELNPGDLISIGGIQFTVDIITSDILMTTTQAYPAVSAIGLDILLQEQEGAHDQADFDSFIKIIVRHQNGNLYSFTNFIDPVTGLLDGDEAIATPSVTPNITVNFNFTDGDGVYQVTLCSIPGWDVAETYQIGDTTFYQDVLYEALLNPAVGAQPDTSPNDWKVVTENEVSAKYCTFVKVVVLCDLIKCEEDAVFEAFCTLREHICDDDVLCKNERFLRAMKLSVLGRSIVNANGRGAYKDIEEMITLGKSICKCC